MTETARVEKKAVSLYPDQWDVVESLAQNDANATGGPPNLSLALRRIVTVYARHLAQPARALVDPPVEYATLDDLERVASYVAPEEA